MKAFFTILFLSTSIYLFGASPSTQSKLDSLQQYIPSNLDLADSLAQELLVEREQGLNDIRLTRIYSTLALINYYKGRYLLSTKYYKDALEYIQIPGDEALEANIWNNLGINYELSNKLEESIEAYLISLDYDLAQKDSLRIYESYINLGLLYSKIADFDSSEDYLQKAYNYFIKQEDLFNAALAAQNLGILYKTKGQNEEAGKFFLKAIELIDQTNNAQGVASLFNDYMYYLITIRDFKAFEALMPEFQEIVQNANNEYIQTAANATFGNYYFQFKKNYPLAIQFFEDAFQGFEKYESTPQLAIIYPLLIESFLETGQKEKVKALNKKYESFLSDRYAAESAGKIAELRTVHEVAQKEAEARVLQVTIAQQKRTVFFSLALAGLLLVISLVVAYFLWVVKNKEKALVLRNIELTNLMNQDTGMLLEDDSQSGLSDAYNLVQMQELYERIKQYVVKEERFLDYNLKLSDVAYGLNTNEKYVSQAVIHGSKMRFTAFLNTHRINRAKNLLQNESLPKLTIGEVAQKSGFSNQPSFQRKFKQITGVTPYTFQRLASLENGNSAEAEDE